MCNHAATARRTSRITAVAALVLAWPIVVRAQAPATYAAPPVTAADRAAAFPDLGDVHAEHSMPEDPLNKRVLLDRLETQDTDGGHLLRWDVDAWVGRSLNKLLIRSEGDRRAGHTERSELELLWGHGFARWWDVVAGARRDLDPGPARSWAAVGVQGTTPYRFDLEATAYFGERGRAALRLKTRYEVLVTNKLILQPLAELNWYAQRDAARALGAGLANAQLGVRLRYELRREVAPYVGLVRETKFGDTAELARAAGRAARDSGLVIGLRLRF